LTWSDNFRTLTLIVNGHCADALPKDDEHLQCISLELLRQSKQLGYSDWQLAVCLGTNELAGRRLREEHNTFPFVKQINTVAADFPRIYQLPLYRIQCGRT